MRILLPTALAVIYLSACSPLSKRVLNKTFEATEENFQDHTGFALYDLAEKKTVYEFNASRYFTPASNTKIFTLFSGLMVLPDSVPAIKYVERGDSLLFWGLGDPSFLYKNSFSNRRVFDFLRSTNKAVYFSTANFHTAHFGSGWAWDDYNTPYSPERSPLPIYGNILSVERFHQNIRIIPSFFQGMLQYGTPKDEGELIRQVWGNDMVFHPGIKSNIEASDIPFHVDQQIITTLLSDTLHRIVYPVNRPILKEAKILYSIPTDSLYKVMMQESDNFIAEQLLLLCAAVLTDSLQPEIAIKRITQNYLSDLADKPVWVDGSGLSRYNLFTPRSIVQLWEKIYEKVPRERLFALLATGGKAGTIRNWYKADKPYIFGKTGSLSNNHCLSGFLVTKSGKTLIFSFMNSNFTTPTNEIRKNMQTILNTIYEKY